MNLIAMDMAETRRNLRMTILRREGGTWSNSEVGKLVNGLMTQASQSPDHPEYVILDGHHTKEATLKALVGGTAYSATQIIGVPNPGLPFVPSFA